MPDNNELKGRILTWLATGETGESSKAMAFCAAGINGRGSYPYDPADLNRCLKLIKHIPEIKEHFESIAKLSTVWRELIKNWDDLETCFLNEVGLDWSKGREIGATKTFKMMRDLGC